MMTVGGFTVPVSVAGPDRGANVVLLAAAAHPLTAYEPLCARLHIAASQTILIGADPRLDDKGVIDILDNLGIPSGVLVGDRSGAELAWEVAAAHPERFTGLVVIDRGHPTVPDPRGVVRDPDCPPVEINTTVLVNSPATRAMAKASQRHVYSDFRLVQFGNRRDGEVATAQLAAEIVLRSTTW